MSAYSVYNTNAFDDRVSYAARVISSGRSTNRTFDTCFEMNDGPAVALALYRRAVKRPRTKLANNLYKYLCRSAIESSINEYKYTSELDLKTLSQNLVRK